VADVKFECSDVVDMLVNICIDCEERFLFGDKSFDKRVSSVSSFSMNGLPSGIAVLNLKNGQKFQIQIMEV
jgi:hypothetical protein